MPAVHSKSGGGGVQPDLHTHSRSGGSVVSVKISAPWPDGQGQEYITAQEFEKTVTATDLNHLRGDLVEEQEHVAETVETTDPGHLRGDQDKEQEYITAQFMGTNRNSQVAVSNETNPNSQSAEFEEGPPNEGWHQITTDGIDDDDVANVKHLAKQYALDILDHHALRYPKSHRPFDFDQVDPKDIDMYLNTEYAMNFIVHNCPAPLPVTDESPAEVSKRANVLGMMIQCLAVDALLP